MIRHANLGTLIGFVAIVTLCIRPFTYWVHSFHPPELVLVQRHAVDPRDRSPLLAIPYDRQFAIRGMYRVQIDGCEATFYRDMRVIGPGVNWQAPTVTHAGSFDVELATNDEEIMRRFRLGPENFPHVQGLWFFSTVKADWNCVPWLGPFTEFRQVYKPVRLPIEAPSERSPTSR